MDQSLSNIQELISKADNIDFKKLRNSLMPEIQSVYKIDSLLNYSNTYKNKDIIKAIELISKEYCLWIGIRGDGNCFYRSVIILYLLSLMSSEDNNQLDQFINKIENLENIQTIFNKFTVDTKTLKLIFLLFLYNLKTQKKERKNFEMINLIQEYNTYPEIDFAAIIISRYLIYLTYQSVKFHPSFQFFIEDNMKERIPTLLLKYYEYAEDIIIPLVAQTFDCNLIVQNLFRQTAASPVNTEKLIYRPFHSQVRDEQREIHVLFTKGHYESLIPKKLQTQNFKFFSKEEIFFRLTTYQNKEYYSTIIKKIQSQKQYLQNENKLQNEYQSKENGLHSQKYLKEQQNQLQQTNLEQSQKNDIQQQYNMQRMNLAHMNVEDIQNIVQNQKTGQNQFKNHQEDQINKQSKQEDLNKLRLERLNKQDNVEHYDTLEPKNEYINQPNSKSSNLLDEIDNTKNDENFSEQLDECKMITQKTQINKISIQQIDQQQNNQNRYSIQNINNNQSRDVQFQKIQGQNEIRNQINNSQVEKNNKSNEDINSHDKNKKFIIQDARITHTQQENTSQPVKTPNKQKFSIQQAKIVYNKLYDNENQIREQIKHEQQQSTAQQQISEQQISQKIHQANIQQQKMKTQSPSFKDIQSIQSENIEIQKLQKDLIQKQINKDDNVDEKNEEFKKKEELKNKQLDGTFKTERDEINKNQKDRLKCVKCQVDIDQIESQNKFVIQLCDIGFWICKNCSSLLTTEIDLENNTLKIGQNQYKMSDKLKNFIHQQQKNQKSGQSQIKDMKQDFNQEQLNQKLDQSLNNIQNQQKKDDKYFQQLLNEQEEEIIKKQGQYNKQTNQQQLKEQQILPLKNSQLKIEDKCEGCKDRIYENHPTIIQFRYKQEPNQRFKGYLCKNCSMEVCFNFFLNYQEKEIQIGNEILHFDKFFMMDTYFLIDYNRYLEQQKLEIKYKEVLNKNQVVNDQKISNNDNRISSSKDHTNFVQQNRRIVPTQNTKNILRQPINSTLKNLDKCENCQTSKNYGLTAIQFLEKNKQEQIGQLCKQCIEFLQIELDSRQQSQNQLGEQKSSITLNDKTYFISDQIREKFQDQKSQQQNLQNKIRENSIKRQKTCKICGNEFIQKQDTQQQCLSCSQILNSTQLQLVSQSPKNNSSFLNSYINPDKTQKQILLSNRQQAKKVINTFVSPLAESRKQNDTYQLQKQNSINQKSNIMPIKADSKIFQISNFQDKKSMKSPNSIQENQQSQYQRTQIHKQGSNIFSTQNTGQVKLTQRPQSSYHANRAIEKDENAHNYFNISNYKQTTNDITARSKQQKDVPQSKDLSYYSSYKSNIGSLRKWK